MIKLLLVKKLPSTTRHCTANPTTSIYNFRGGSAHSLFSPANIYSENPYRTCSVYANTTTTLTHLQAAGRNSGSTGLTVPVLQTQLFPSPVVNIRVVPLRPALISFFIVTVISESAATAVIEKTYFPLCELTMAVNDAPVGQVPLLLKYSDTGSWRHSRDSPLRSFARVQGNPDTPEWPPLQECR